ncbi:Ni/Fe hydrogenase subunit alpha [Paraconexibacter sp.]|uniref:Ni/Fe hydrogenase subunit alpha n=1 Tax=Paraconexibacter sp. TaxID=2949640 RepID=UPI003565383B
MSDAREVPIPPRRVSVQALARVEGEGALRLHVEHGAVTTAELNIYEPPRFFEAFLRGRGAHELPDLTARICGICPVAYQMSAVAAVEDAYGVTVSEPVRLLRRLLYCGEWIESHALHVHLLHAPDFLGYSGMADMARDHAAVVERGLRIKKAGNALMATVGGREVHPINVRVGGFYRAPSVADLRALATDALEPAREEAIEMVRWAATLPYPDFTHDHELVALWTPDEYPLERGRLRSTGGLDVAPAAFEDAISEEQVPHSTALHARLHAREDPYLTGPLARWALNRETISPLAREVADEVGLEPVCRNPFRAILVRCVEILFALDEALRLIADYEPPDPPADDARPREGVGHAITEAPRGALYQRYEIDAGGIVRSARIVPPTSQNQRAIEADVRAFATPRLQLADEDLALECERAIRNHDPCISCATHFLDLTVTGR